MKMSKASKFYIMKKKMLLLEIKTAIVKKVLVSCNSIKHFKITEEDTHILLDYQ